MIKLIKQRINRVLSKWLIQPVAYIFYKLRYQYFDPSEKTIRVWVRDINLWYRGNRYSQVTYPGQNKGGDWSKNITPKDEIINTWEKYDGIKQHYLKKHIIERFGMEKKFMDLIIWMTLINITGTDMTGCLNKFE